MSLPFQQNLHSVRIKRNNNCRNLHVSCNALCIRCILWGYCIVIWVIYDILIATPCIRKFQLCECQLFIHSWVVNLWWTFICLFFFFQLGDNQNDSFETAPKYVKHISKSASELSNRDGTKAAPPEKSNEPPQRARGAINPGVSGVLQRTHGFFSTLKVNQFISWK